MGTGIIVCGLNGSGKSTLGKALAEALAFHFIDAEDLYFSKIKTGYCYDSPRSREEAEKLLVDTVQKHEHFVLAAVKGDYGESVLSLYRCAVLLDAPKEIRMQRVRDRSFQRFGKRTLPGGDLYEREEAFFKMAESRRLHEVEEWTKSLDCPIFCLDGTRPVEENVARIRDEMIDCGLWGR